MPRVINDDEVRAYDNLVVAAGTLVTVSEQAIDIIEERFEGLLRNPTENVKAAIAACPSPSAGAVVREFRDEDLKIEYYKAAGQFSTEEDLGAAITHLPTGIKRMSDSKRTRSGNTDVAMKALRRAVEGRWERET